MEDVTETSLHSEEEEDEMTMFMDNCNMANVKETNNEEGEEVFYDAQTEQFYEQECVYSDPSSSKLGNKMRERIRMKELIDARSKSDTALYNIKDRLARAGPVIYALTQCETGTRVE